MSKTNYDIGYRKRQIEANVIPKSRYEFKCLYCKEMFQTIYNHHKYCNDPCVPLTEKQRKEGITDAVRRGEAVAIPREKKPKNCKKSVTKDLGEMSRRMLSMKL